MALTERTVEDKIEIVGDYKHIQVRTATIIERDASEISRSFHRHVISPLDDVSSPCAAVPATAPAAHTDDVQAAYQAHLDAQAEV